MSPTPIQMAVVTASAMLAAAIGVFATLRRGHWLVTLLFSSAFLCVASFQAGTLAILHADGAAAARTWATYLASTSALASWLWLGLSVVLARPRPLQHLRQAAAYLTLALIGCVVLFGVAGTPYVVSAVEGTGSSAVIVLGGMGKVYLMYLVVVMVAVLMNLESMLRSAPATTQPRLRSLFAAFVIGILCELLLVSAGLLQGRILVTWMVAGAVPMFIAGVMTAFALARQSLSDMAVPVARPVIYYSSVSLTLAAVFLLSMGVLSKLLPMLPGQWKQLASVAFYVVAGGGALALVFSPRTSRAVRRFVDRNFYANRYDYRREWERVSRAITPTGGPEDICRQIETLMSSVFDAERVAVHLRDPRGEGWVLVHPPAAGESVEVQGVVHEDNPVVVALERTRAPLIFRELSGDLDLIPVLVENRAFIEYLKAAVCAPLHVGDDLVGLLWLSAKRTEEPYSFEDAEFLGAMSRQLAAALGFARLADQLAETRQLESLHRLSSFVLHDMKNQVSGLSLLVENAKRHLSDPEFQRDAIQVLGRSVQNLRQLIAQVSGVGRPPVLQPAEVALRPVIDEALAAAGLREGENSGVRVEVADPEAVRFRLDPTLMGRVITNLVTNAREAMKAPGKIAIRIGREPPAGEILSITVRDDGPGMTEAFMRHSLFRPFATSKESGLGIGLMQCKTIVEAHGGSIRVESRPGRGTCFEIRVPGAGGTAEVAVDGRKRGNDAG
jgi:putative PEP-CTERM system histidine kinase